MVSITPVSAGVSILNPQASYPVINGQVKFTIAGAQPGDMVAFYMEGTTIGAGPVEGSDICCNGTIKVEIPKDLPCEKSTVDVSKMCEPARFGKYPLGPAATGAGFVSVCHITVKTTGPQSGTLSVADQLSGGGTVISAASATTPSWTCGATGCAINGSQLNQTASTSVMDVTVAFPSAGQAGEAKNCALLAVRGKPADKDCVSIPVEGSVEVTKQCEPAKHVWIGDMPPRPNMPPNGYSARCHIKVSTTGTISSPISVSEVLDGAGTVKYVGSSDPWACVPPMVPGNTPMNCTLPANTMTGPADVSVIDVNVTFANAGDVKEAKNCALTSFNGTDKKSCDDFAIDEGTVSIDKTCEPAVYGKYPVSPVATGLGLHANCRITVTTTGPQSGTLTVGDSLLGAGMVVNMNAPAPWTCTTPNCSVNGAALDQVTSTTVINAIAVFSNTGNAMEAKNCAQVDVAGKVADESCTPIRIDNTGKLTVLKEALYNGNHITNQTFPIAVTCGGMTTNGTVSDGVPYVQTGLPLNASCTVVEGAVTAAAGLCKEGQTASWITTYTPPTAVSASAAGGTITITNRLDCKPGDPKGLEVKKVVINNAPGSIAGLVFPYQTTCTNSPGTAGLGTLTDGQTQPTWIYVANTSCTVTEGAIPATNACGKGMMPSWSTVYLPSQTVPLVPAGQLVTIQNTLDCVPIIDPTPSTQTVTKVCEPATEIVGAINSYQSICHITVSTTGPVPASLTVSDTLVGGGTITSMTGPAPWSCTGTNCVANGGQLNQTASTSVINAVVSFPSKGHVSEGRNCATLVTNGTPVESCTGFTVGEGDKASISITKRVVSNAPDVLPSIAYPVTATCDANVASINDGQTITIGNLAAGTACTVTEGPLTQGVANQAALDACGGAGTPVWTTSYAPSQTVNAGPGANVTITNTLDCKPKRPPVDNRMYIKKVVVNNSPGSLEGLEYDITSQCTNTTQPTGFAHFSDGETVLFHNYEEGMTCNLSEVIPATTACGKGMKDVWSTTYSPSQTVNLSPNGETITVTNTLNCERINPPVDNRMYIKKVVINNAPGSLEGVEYDITSQCTNTTQPTGFAHFSDGETVLFHNYEEGMTCNLSEVIPATTACGKGMKDVWSTTYSPSQTVNLSPNGETITVTNTLNCEPIKGSVDTTFSVRKVAIYDGEPIANVSFPMTVTCSDGNSQVLNVSVDQNQTISGLPEGTTCSVAEGAFPTTGLCPAGATEQWATTYVPANASNTTSAMASVIVTVRNELTCRKIVVNDNPLACDPATATNAGDLCRCRFDNMSPVSKTACECKDGFTLKAGQGCVRKVVEPKCDPATTVSKGGKCVCEYKNMVQTSPSACACTKGFKFAAGKGCYKPEPLCKQGQRYEPSRQRCEPICGKGFDFSIKRNACFPRQEACKPGTKLNPKSGKCDVVRPDCPQGTVYNPKRNRCIATQPVCRKPFVWDPKRNACVEQVRRCEPGTVPFRGKCIRVPQCPRGQIAIPGTPICVAIGGGGGRPKDTGPKECRDGDVIVPCR